jgi:hypothetical protein
MRKIRVALVILLLLNFIVASSVASASTNISPGSMGDTLSIAKSRATLQNIEQKLVSGNSDIHKASQELSALTRYMAKQYIDSASKVTSTNKTRSAIKPPATGMPMSGIGDAISALGSINVKLVTPSQIAKSIDAPRLQVIQ